MYFRILFSYRLYGIIENTIYDRRVVIVYQVLRSFSAIAYGFMTECIHSHRFLYQYITDIAFAFYNVANVPSRP